MHRRVLKISGGTDASISNLKKFTITTATVGALGAAALGLAGAADAGAVTAFGGSAADTAPARAADDSGSGQGTVALPPGGPAAVFPQNQIIGGASPYLPFGTNPDVPYGVWAP